MGEEFVEEKDVMTQKKKKHSFLKRNGLSIVMLLFFAFTLVGEWLTGWQQYLEDMQKMNGPRPGAFSYLLSGHFIQATFENWESEFLQMAMYVILTACLFQVGSAESKSPDKEEDVDREPKPHAHAPWPVRQGGWILSFYKYSLSLGLGLLFLFSFVLHFHGSMRHYNLEQSLEGKPLATVSEYLGNSSFWFESFQNWQSEFLSVAAIVLLSIWLRQIGSPESKPVDAGTWENK